MARIRTSSLQIFVLALTVLLNCSSDVVATRNTMEHSKVVEYLRRLEDEEIASTTSTVPPAANHPPKHPPKTAPKKKPSSDTSSSTTSSSTTTTSSSSSSKPVKIHNANDTDNSSSPKHDPNDRPGKKPVLLLVGSAAVGTLAVAAATYGRKKRRVEIPAHPLAGSVNRRMQMFQNLAADRTPRSGGMGRGVLDGEVGEYRRAEGESLGIAVV